MERIFLFPYFIVFAFVLCFGYLYYRTNKMIYIKTIFIILFLFVACRGNGSGDYFTYLEYSDQIRSIGDVLNYNFPMEIGFRLISYIKNLINAPDQFVIIVMAAISVGATYFMIVKTSNHMLLSVFIFLPIMLQFDMHATRSGVAASLGLIAMYHFKNKNWKQFILFMIMTISFHRSSLVILCIPTYYFIREKCYLTIRKEVKIQILLIIIAILPLFSIVFQVLPLLNIDNVLFQKLENYLFFSRFSYPIKLYDPRIILSFAIFLSSALVYYKTKKEDLHYVNVFSFFGLLFMLLFKDSTFLSLRLSSFFDRGSIYYVPVLIDQFDKCIKNSPLKNYNLIRIFFKYKYVLASLIYIVLYSALVFITCVPYYFFVS